jgi:MFS transporter, DHA1 family, tetracycline resistance protein
MSSPSPATTSGRSAAGVLFVVVLLDLIAFGTVLPLLPSFGARYVSSGLLIGLLVSADSAMQFFVAPRWGRFSDRVGRRPVLLLGLAGNAVAYVILGVAGSFGTLIFARLLSGSLGATGNIAQAYLADVTPAERRAQAMGLIGAAFGLGFTVGPAIGGVSSRFGHGTPAFVAAGLSTASLLLAALRLPETREHRPAPTARVVSLRRRYLRPFAVAFATTLAFTAMYAVFPLFCQQLLGYDRSGVSSFFVVLGLVTIVVQGRLIGRLAPRYGDRRLMLAGAAAMALGFALLPFAPETASWARSTLVASGVALLGAGFSLVGPSVAAFVSRTSDAADQGIALGTLQSGTGIARIVGPPAAGLVLELAGARTPFVAAAVAAAMAGVVAAVMGKDG